MKEQLINMPKTKAQKNYSVLMSVYYKENPIYLRDAIISIFSQSLKTNDFICVCDGPLTTELDEVLAEFVKKYSAIMRLVRLPTNQGLGNALKVGVPLCKNELIMRADSDDISLPDRAEKEIDVLLGKHIDIVSSTVSLFSKSASEIYGERKLPETNEEIIKFAHVRSPFNHPSVLYKKSSVLAAGNYETLLFKEDYYLWVRMILNGCKSYNIQEPLVLMRSDNATLSRRRGKCAYQSQKWLLKFMRNKRFIGRPQYLYLRFVYWAQHISPRWLVSFVYSHFLHKKNN